jgi:antirestriction protein ArdC
METERYYATAAHEITPEPGEDHAAYIASWLRALKNDKKFVFVAASHAQRAADYLHSL